MYNLANYIPDPLLESYDFLRTGLLYWLIKFSVVDPSTTFSSSAKKSFGSVDTPRKLSLFPRCLLHPILSSDRSLPNPPIRAETSAARLALSSASSSLTSTENSLRQAEGSLSDLATKFGPKGEWKKLDGTCIEKNLGEYTYELCFFGGATQKSNKGGSSNSLGSVHSLGSLLVVAAGTPFANGDEG